MDHHKGAFSQPAAIKERGPNADGRLASGPSVLTATNKDLSQQLVSKSLNFEDNHQQNP
jgi:hypothetical protein